MAPGRKERREIKALFEQSTEEAQGLPDETLRELTRLLEDARHKLAGDLGDWLAQQDPGDRFTGAKYRELLLALRRGRRRPLDHEEHDDGRRKVETPRFPRWLPVLAGGLLIALEHAREKAARMVVEHVMAEIAALSPGEAVKPVDPQAVKAAGKEMLEDRLRYRAEQYGQGVMADLKRQLHPRAGKDETIGEMTVRLQRLGGKTGDLPEGVTGAGGVADTLIDRAGNAGVRVVVTEVANAYTSQKLEAGRQFGDENDVVMLKTWDASHY